MKAGIEGFRGALRALIGSGSLVVAAAMAQDGAAPAEAPPAPPATPPAQISTEVHPTSAIRVEHAEKGLLLGIAHAGSRLVAVGGNGVIVASDDGQSWSQIASPVDVSLTAVSFADPQHGWAVGHDAVILYTADGGRSWTLQNFQPELNVPFFSVLALDAQHAYAAGAFGTLKATEDGGQHWNDVAADAISSDKLHLNAVTKLNNGNLFIAGEHGLAAVSTDGHDWRKVTSPYEGSFFGAQPWGEQGALAFGLRGNIYLLADVHTGSWKKVDADTTASMFGGLSIPEGKAVLVGGDGTLVAIDPAGTARRLQFPIATQGQAAAYTSLVGANGALLVVGESGVTRITP